MRSTHAQINLKALRHNFLKIKKTVGKRVGILATVKQNAYGHGAVEVSSQLQKLGVSFLGVARVDEAVVLRNRSIKSKILNLGVISSREEARHIVDLNVSQTVNTLTQVRYLNKFARAKKKKVKVHLKIDTGMTRLGLPFQEARKLLQGIKKLSGVKVEGVFTHFPVADKDPEFTSWQITQFSWFVDRLKEEGFDIPFFHVSNSAGVLNYPAGHFNLVRPGIALYGVSPFTRKLEGYLPVMSVKSKVVFERKVPKKTPVSYGQTFVSKKSMYVATIPIGYGDGYPFHLSGKGEVLIRGKRYPVLGRVCMDFIIVGSYTERFRIGEKVVIMGKQNKGRILCEEIASLSRAIPYEILCRFGKNLPHVYVK